MAPTHIAWRAAFELEFCKILDEKIKDKNFLIIVNLSEIIGYLLLRGSFNSSFDNGAY